ncbi:MAG: hypothetical protein ACRDCE_00025 [Cetobacterium sp.]|uniref:hypothetical protein n=1 Tax=Cetobacterium sp. TaxID=2071632 RepID=UPI003EE61B85
MAQVFKKKYREVVAPVVTNITSIVPASKSNPTNMYKVVVTFMENDADGYPTDTVYFASGKESKMIEFLNFLGRCAVAYPNGKGGHDNYSHVEGFRDWVIDEDIPEEEQPDSCLEWAYWDWEYCCSFEAVDVTYYDASGIEHHVHFE